MFYTMIICTKVIYNFVGQNFVMGSGLFEGCNCPSSRFAHNETGVYRGRVGLRGGDSCPPSIFAHKEPYVYRSRVGVRGWWAVVPPADLITRSLCISRYLTPHEYTPLKLE